MDGRSDRALPAGKDHLTLFRKYFHNAREPISITVAGQTIYVMLSAVDVSAVLRNTKDLTFHEYIKDMMKQFGSTSAGVEAMWATSSPSLDAVEGLQPNPLHRPLAHLAEAFMKSQLHPGPLFDELQSETLKLLHGKCTWRGMSTEVILSSSSNPTERKVSLLRWAQRTIVEGASEAFFGPALLEMDSALLDHFSHFDNDIWQLLYRIPKPWSNRMLGSKAKLHLAILKYVQLPSWRRDNACWLVKTTMEEMRARNIEDGDIATNLMMIHWVYVRCIAFTRLYLRWQR
jgi:hypothetical protein